MNKEVRLGSSVREGKELRFWLIYSIVSLLVGSAIVLSFSTVIDKPFANKYPADHYWYVYLAITFFTMTLLGIAKFFKCDESQNKWLKTIVQPIMRFFEFNMWVAIMTIIIVIAGLLVTGCIQSIDG